MIVSGNLIEYLDNGKFICALVTDSQTKRLRLINQNGREVNLPLSRVVHSSQQLHATDCGKESIINLLKDTARRRLDLMEKIDLEEIWELVSEETDRSFKPSFLAELCFGEKVNDDIISALLRSIFVDKLYFKFKEGFVLANSPEQVEQLKIQRRKEEKRLQLITEGAKALQSLMVATEISWELPDLIQETLAIIKDFYLNGNDAAESETARKILKEAGLHKTHDPFHLMVKAGIWSPHENIPLLRHALPVNFSLAARQQAELLLQRGQDELFTDKFRKDLTNLSPITIDGPTTLDFDDALTVEEQDGNYLVGIHISDVAHYVRPGDPLFLEAMHRGTSIYFPEGQVPMLPRHLSQGICSLIQDEIRATFSFMILLSEDVEVLKVKIFPSIIRVKRRLTYDEVDKMLDTDHEIRLLNKIRKKLRRKRLENGALLLPFPDVNIFIDHQGKVHVSLGKSDTPARTIVSEMMILANQEAAKFISDRMVPGLFRSQPELQKRIVHGDDDDLFQNTLQRKQLPRGELSTVAKPHSGLGVSQYSTVTSPIRRLLDLVMQHQLNSIVRRQEPCFTEEMCKDFNSVLTRTITTANNVRQQRQRYWLLKYLAEKEEQIINGLIIQVGPKRTKILLTETMMDIDLPTNGAQGLSPNTNVKIKIVKIDPLDNIARFDWT